MASSFRKVIKQFSEDPGSDILCPIVHDNHCADELPKHVCEAVPQKFRSPPPKPPRRRYSEQLSSSAETFPLSKQHCLEKNQHCGIEPQEVINSSVSSASLPPNWTTRLSCHSPVGDKNLHKNSCTTLEQVKKCFFGISYADADYAKKITHLVENLIKTDKNVCSESNKNKLQSRLQLRRNESNYLKVQMRNVDEGFWDKSKIVNSVIQKCQNGKINIKPLHSECHRRHHSDPALPCFGVTKQKNNFDNSTRRSYSFMSFKNDDQRKKDSSNSCLACKEMDCLQEEINILKKMNDKLWQNLCSVQATLDSLQSTTLDKDGNVSIAELLSQIYCAQKARDCAVEERIKLALEERDAVLLEMDSMVKTLIGNIEDSFQNDVSLSNQNGEKASEEIQEVLKEMEFTENPFKLLQHQRLLLGHIYHSKELKHDYLSHELRLILNERDNLIEKVKKLEEELKDLKLCREITHLDNKHWEDSLLNMLCHIIHQRDLLLSKMDNVRNIDLINIRLSKNQKKMSCGHDSLSKHESIVPEICLPSDVETNTCTQNFDITTEDTKVLKDEIILLNNALLVEKGKKEKAEAKCQRLERLVNVLRRKIDGKNTGIFV